MADQQQAPGLLANILAVAGFIILIVIIVWGAYQLLRLTGTGVASLFSRFGDDSEIRVSVPSAPARSGTALPISWEYEPEENGAYAFMYQCRAGFRFDIGSGASVQSIPCGNAFTLGSNTSLTVMPVLSGTTTVDVPVTVVFMPASTSTTERPQGTATIRVATADASQPVPPSSPTSPSSIPTQPSSPAASVQAGPADLTVRILAVGVVDNAGNFMQRAPMHSGEIAAVKFDIKNEGAGASGKYSFTVHLPMYPAYSYVSPVQTSLAPGAHIESTLRFRPVVSGGGTISVVADSGNAVKESNENNNGMSIWMPAGNFPYQYQSPVIF